MSELKKNIWKPFGESAIGASHTRKDMPNQDAYKEYRGEIQEPKEATDEPINKITPTVVAVSDGHGGNKYIRSGVGSLLAVEVMCNLAKSMAREIPTPSKRVRISEVDANAEQIKAQLLNMWQRAIDQYSRMYPMTEKEQSFLNSNCSEKDRAAVEKDFAIAKGSPDLKDVKPSRVAYGCTFLAAIAYEDVVLILQYGDGDVLGLYPNGEVKELIVADSRNMGNETLSLCRLENPAEIQHSVLVGSEIPILITLSTDGVKNSFDDLTAEEESGFYKIPVDIKNLLLKSSVDTKAIRTVLKSELERYTKHGAGDDVTLGVLFDVNRIRAEESSSTQTTSVMEKEPLVDELDVIKENPQEGGVEKEAEVSE